MNVRVRYFAALRERLGASEESLELGPGASVAGALEGLVGRHPELQGERFAVALNQRYAASDEALHDGDELALLPPVSGG